MGIKIRNIKAKEILDSRGNPTIEVELEINKGVFKASVPSGASTGKYEAKALKASKAVENINKVIALKLIGKDATNQEKIDKLMIKLDGTKDKSKLGANAILAVSIAVCRAGASIHNLPLYKYINNLAGGGPASLKLPRPAFNILNGGAHAKNDLDIQEFMVIPFQSSFSENLKKGKKIYNNLKKILEKEFNKELNIGDEGGFAPLISKTEQALNFIIQAIGDYENIKIGLDCAATQFFEKDKYKLDGKEFNKKELSEFYRKLIEKYPIIFIEDGFAEEDWQGFKDIMKITSLGDVIIVGDDLTVTNKERVRKAIKENCISGVIIKPNQIGTITETLETVKIAKKAGLKIIVSHRSGETMDDFISDLAVGIGADFIKSGAPNPKERMAKYSRLLFIEQELKNN